ncbi:unnamed protein product [Rotaria sordida]|uniref:Tudor domain-containing protein n=1 Tax=Rotaria sordida TaxID=392033 RepID=A0A814U1Y3_9BILA|nr:unnamed protein product [Rotaria sordida]
MRSSQSTTYNTNQMQQQQQQQTFDRIPPGFSAISSSTRQQPQSQPQRLTLQNEFYNNATSAIQQRPLTRPLQKPIVQQSPSAPTSTDSSSSSEIQTLPPQDGYYTITHVYSAIEFYGHSQGREKELDAFYKHLEDIYNNNTNDQSLSVHFFMEGIPCVIQQGDKYHRVIIKHRESESRVLVTLIDRGDEIIVDTSELLKLEKKYFTIPAFAQPFRLFNYDESHSTANITRKLKRLILNQRVHITQHLPMINGFYPVEVKLSDNQLVNQILLVNDNNPIFSPPMKSSELQSITIQQDINTQRINDDLPAPQKLLTATTISGRTQPGRFTAKSPVRNESTSRFSRSEQQQDESRSFGQQTQTFTSRTTNGFQQLMNDQSRSTSRGFSTDEQQTNQRNGFGNNRGGGFGDRGGRNGFVERNFDNKNENGMQRTGGFNNRTGGFNERGFRNEGFHNQDEDNNENNSTQRFGNRGGFSGERGSRGGGFQSYHDKENSGDNGRRGGRGGPRGGGRGGFGDRGDRGGFGDRGDRGGFGDRGGRGGFGDRGGRGGFGDRGGRGGFGDRGGRGGGRGGRTGGFEDRSDNDFQSNTDNNEPIKTFSGWPNVKSPIKSFEVGDHFVENEIPQDTFQFVISHIETSNDFFIQLYSKGNELSTLSDKLQEEYKNAPELNFNSIEINQACLAKSSDECWYRAIILSINLNKINVRFIDFGDTIDVDKKSIRQLEKKFSLKPPYAYRCMLENVEVNENIDRNKIIEKCAEEIFNGKIKNKLFNDKYLLQSDNFQKLMIDINAIKLKLKTNIKCHIIYINIDKYEFYIQNDNDTMIKINNEITTTDDISLDDIKINSMVIALYDNELCRAIIQEDLNENVRLYFVDYGYTNIYSKTLLKQCNEQLKTYPYQAKRCHLYDIPSDMLDQAFKKLHEYIKSDKIEISIINQHEDLFDVLIYIDDECFNKQFHKQSLIIDQYETNNDINDQSSTTTIKEQEKPISTTGKRNNEEILSPIGNSLTTSMNIKRQKSESEIELNSIQYHRAILTYTDENKPMVYVQLVPESEAMMEQINDLIDSIVQENKHNSSYEIGDNVIAQFTDDMHYYRARIESYSDLTQNYTVYFLDYGNFDKNVPKNNLYSYSDELQRYDPQAHGYLLEKLTSEIWINKIRKLIKDKENEEIEFYFIDKNQSIIHINFDNENQIYNYDTNQPKTFTANISGTNNDCFYIHILPDTDTLICEMDELLETHINEYHTSDLWLINDLCIVYNNELNQYFRGKILSINNNKYDIQCIDYGNILSNITNDKIYLLINNNLLKQLPLARQCRLYSVNNKNQIKAIKEIIQHIPQTERVTITVENDQNDQCMDVMLFRENHEIVNDRYQFDDNDIKQNTDTDKQDTILTNSSDSAIAADDDETSNVDVITIKNDQHLTSPIGTPQAESTHQFGDSTNVTMSNSSPSMTINQTIDFGENDPSTSNTTIKDDTENENVLN